MLDKARGRRLLYARWIVPLAMLLLAGRLWYVQIVMGPHFRQMAEQNHLRIDVIEPPRGMIYDRYDQELVENVPLWTVSVVPSDLDRSAGDHELSLLASLTGADLSRFQLALRQNQDNPVVPVTVLSGVPRDTALTLMEYSDVLPGVQVQSRAFRQYVDGPAFAQILGYMGQIDQAQYTASLHTDQPYALNADVGQAGVEQRYETDLRGKLGHQTVAVDVRGRVVNQLGTDPAAPGNSVELTLDASVQRAAYSALGDAINRSHATGGAAVAIDPRDGAVVALLSLPSFDNNLFANGISQADWLRLNQDPSHPLLNHAVAAQYPPGPMLEPFIAAAALQEQVVGADKAYACPSVLAQQGWTFHNWLSTTPASVTLPQALAQRCDTLFAALAGGAKGSPGLDLSGLGQQKLLSWLQQFGFGSPTDIDLPAESAGFVPTPTWKQQAMNAGWSPIDTYLVAAGAGPLSVTPVQIAVAMAALANDGTVWQPQIIQRLLSPDGHVLGHLSPKATRRLDLSRSTLQSVGLGLTDSVTNGPSKAAKLAGIAVAGMGGAATAGSDNVGEQGLNSWWAGYAPASDPQLVVTVLVTGGTDPDAALPVGRAMLEAALKPNRTDGA